MKLQNALDRVTDDVTLGPPTSSDWELIVDAARRVANLEWEAATDVLEHALPSLGGSRTESGMTVIEIVNAALGITTEDE